MCFSVTYFKLWLTAPANSISRCVNIGPHQKSLGTPAFSRSVWMCVWHCVCVREICLWRPACEWVGVRDEGMSIECLTSCSACELWIAFEVFAPTTRCLPFTKASGIHVSTSDSGSSASSRGAGAEVARERGAGGGRGGSNDANALWDSGSC